LVALVPVPLERERDRQTGTETESWLSNPNKITVKKCLSQNLLSLLYSEARKDFFFAAVQSDGL